MANTKDDPIIINGDWGNSELKTFVASHNGKPDIWLMPHGYRVLSEMEWGRMVQREKTSSHRLKKTQVFTYHAKSGDRYLMIGRQALSSGRDHRRFGGDKLTDGYFNAVVVATLLEMFPNGHDNIFMGIGYPPSEIQNIETLIGLVGGSHRVTTLDGRKVKFFVRGVIPWDEPIGSIEWMRLQNRSGLNLLKPGDQCLSIDIGGRIGSIGPVEMDVDGTLVPLWDDFVSLENGIVLVLEELEKQLKNLYPNEFRGMEFREHTLREVLRTRHISLSGHDPIDVTEAVTQSLGIIDQAWKIVEQKFNRARDFKLVTMSGGAQRDLFEDLRAEFRDHRNVMLVDNKEKVIFANGMGGFWITISALMAQGKLPDNYRGVYAFSD